MQNPEHINIKIFKTSTPLGTRFEAVCKVDEQCFSGGVRYTKNTDIAELIRILRMYDIRLSEGNYIL